MSVGHTWVAPEEWEKKIDRVMELQGSIGCQDRIIEASEIRIQEVNQMVENRAIELEADKNAFLSQDASLANDIEGLNSRVVNLISRQNQIHRSNVEIQHTINQLYDEKTRLAQSGAALYREAKAQYILMKHDADFDKFAHNELLSIEVRINQGANTNWTSIAMLSNAQNLLSDVYAMALQVKGNRENYEIVQKQCIELGTTVLEQAREIRGNAKLDGYENFGEEIDYWTGNALKDIEAEVQVLLETINSKRNAPDFQVPELREILNRLYELKNKKDDVIKCAMDNVAHSQMVQAEVNHAGDIIMNLHGFTLDGEGYEFNDERRPFIARFSRKHDGLEVEFISAYDQASDTYKFIHRMNSATYADPNIMATLMQGILNSLTASGMIRDITHGTCSPEPQLEVFNSGNPQINEQTRIAQGISNEALTYIG